MQMIPPFHGDSHSLQTILKIMKQFQELFSVKINVEKCEACWFGKTKHQNTQPARCKWTSLTNSFYQNFR